jgi:prepilin-type N-terminal cleavage/methylation domain-containing protein
MTARRHSAQRRRRGLTLLEVIVAMALMAIGITAVLQAITACLRSSTASAEYSRGVLLAQRVATDYQRNEELDVGVKDGEFDDTPGYTWEVQVASADDEGLYPVRVTVAWANGARRYVLDTSLRPHARPEAPAAEPDSGASDTAGTGATAGTGGATGTGATAGVGGAGASGGGAGAGGGRKR